MPATFDEIMEVEDSLQLAGVFRNGLQPEQTAHSDSYMTIVEYPILNEWLKTQPFTPERLADCVDYWLTNPNMQPPLRLVAKAVQRHLLAAQNGATCPQTALQ